MGLLIPQPLSVSPDFAKQVKQLVERWKPIQDGYEQLARQHLEFAIMIKDLWGRAKALDRGNATDHHQNHIRLELQKIVHTNDPSILSRWKTIGEYAEPLLAIANQLPPERDHLYELALAVKEAKPVANWAEENRIYPTVSFRAIKDLKNANVKSKSKAKSTRHYSVTFTFALNTEAEAVVNVLRDVIQHKSVQEIKASHPSIRSECERSLGSKYESAVKNKFKPYGADYQNTKRKLSLLKFTCKWRKAISTIRYRDLNLTSQSTT